MLAGGLAFGLFVVRTPLGRRMRAMRDDALAASAAGAEVRRLRMVAFVLASLYGGVAGVLYAGETSYIAPETFSIADMFLLLAMVIIGGRQSLAGCVIGAIGLTVVQQEPPTSPPTRSSATESWSCSSSCSRRPAWSDCRNGPPAGTADDGGSTGRPPPSSRSSRCRARHRRPWAGRSSMFPA